MIVPPLVHLVWIQGEPHMRQAYPDLAAMLDRTRSHVAAARDENGQPWSVRLWDDGAGRLLLAALEEEHPQVLAGLSRAYSMFEKPASKADLLRLAVVYQHGGVYQDTDMMLLSDNFMWVFGSNGGVAPRFVTSRDPLATKADALLMGDTLSNFWFAAEPRSPIVLRILQESVARSVKLAQRLRLEQDQTVPSYHWTVTGPRVVQDVLAEDEWAPWLRDGRVRLLPPSIILGPIEVTHVLGTRAASMRSRPRELETEITEAIPGALWAHSPTNSWVNGSLAAIGRALLNLRGLIFDWYLLVVLALLVIVVVLSVVLAAKLRRPRFRSKTMRLRNGLSR
jgi:hypothetical protein